MSSRRDFLQKLGISAVALQLLPFAGWAANAEVSDKPYDGPVLRVAIMGLGSYGTRVAEAMQNCSRAKLTGLISGTPSKVKAWQSKYGIPEKNCYNYDNFDQIKNNPDIDAVYVITPNALHHNHVIRVVRQVNMRSVKSRWPSMRRKARKWWMPANRRPSSCWLVIACISNRRRWR